MGRRSGRVVEGKERKAMMLRRSVTYIRLPGSGHWSQNHYMHFRSSITRIYCKCTQTVVNWLIYINIYTDHRPTGIDLFTNTQHITHIPSTRCILTDIYMHVHRYIVCMHIYAHRVYICEYKCTHIYICKQNTDLLIYVCIEMHIEQRIAYLI